MRRFGYVAGIAALLGLLTGCVSPLGVRPWPTRDAEQQARALSRDIRAGLMRRQIGEAFARYEAYSVDRLAASSGTRTYSDKTGNCRLAWFDWMLRHPVESIPVAEAFSWQLNEAAREEAGGVRRVIAMAAEKLDAGTLHAARRLPRAIRPKEALEEVEQAVTNACEAMVRAWAPLSDDERTELAATLYPQSTGKVTLGHRFADVAKGRRVCDLLEKSDRQALVAAAAELASLAEPRLLDALAGLPGDGIRAVEIVTPAGRMLVGGRGSDHYDLEALSDVIAVVDLGGDDTYVEGTVGFARPVLAVIDLGGNDRFTGKLPGIQGGAVLGASLLIVRGGDDVFEAEDVAQGSALGGVGILVASGGNQQYTGRCRVQGQAVAGIGLLLDRDGDDRYRAALLAQGVGGPLGFGALIDQDGADAYYAGGLYSGGYDDSPGYGAWSQGVGVGPRGTANGGIGLLLDGGGDDLYEYDYFSHGGGYWFAVGIARDFGGNDQRLGATRTRFDGSERTVRPFVRWGVGYGCHYALGFLIDDAGNDTYTGNTASVAFSWDIGVGAILDFAGNDVYRGSSTAYAANAGLAVLLDAAGDDRYAARTIGHANAKVDYHPAEQAGGNFAFLIDRGGDDDFGPAGDPAAARGWAGGFLFSGPISRGQMATP